MHQFPVPIASLPQAELPFPGVVGYLAQGETFQALFFHFPEETVLPAHAHAAQWGIVVEGQLDLTIGGVLHKFVKGDHYQIPAGVEHSGLIHADSLVIDYFDQADRYSIKK